MQSLTEQLNGARNLREAFLPESGFGVHSLPRLKQEQMEMAETLAFRAAINVIKCRGLSAAWESELRLLADREHVQVIKDAFMKG